MKINPRHWKYLSRKNYISSKIRHEGNSNFQLHLPVRIYISLVKKFFLIKTVTSLGGECTTSFKLKIFSVLFIFLTYLCRDTYIAILSLLLPVLVFADCREKRCSSILMQISVFLSFVLTLPVYNIVWRSLKSIKFLYFQHWHIFFCVLALILCTISYLSTSIIQTEYFTYGHNEADAW